MKMEKKIMDNYFQQMELELSEKQKEQFLEYYHFLIEKNKVMNLTTITEYQEVITKHFMDSLYLSKVYDLRGEMSLLDLGTGAGFPGVPLKIMFPHLNIVLMDSLNKRIKFLDELIRKLELQDIIAIHGRAEELGNSIAYRESFDLCVSRAVSKLCILSEYCIPFVKVNGFFIPYKSGLIEKEYEEGKKAVNVLGGKLKRIERFTIPGTELERTLLIIEKIKKTPKVYPRIAGKPSKEPIQ